jgi:DNA-binding winged helix-turn-helix (wHTH) protein
VGAIVVCYSFGPFELDPEARVLRRQSESVVITAKIFELLLVLVQHRGRLVTKEELLATLWPRTAVEEANLAQSMSVLRKVLDDSPKEHRYIMTIPGRGYQFVASVVETSRQNRSGPPPDPATNPVVPPDRWSPSSRATANSRREQFHLSRFTPEEPASLHA